MNMRFHSLLFALLASFACCWGGAALAASGPPPELSAEWEARMAEADSLKKQGRAIRESAEARFSEQEKACYAKFLVTDCINAAKKERIPHLVEARRLENQASHIEREVRHAQSLESEQRHARELAERESELPGRAARVEADVQAHEADVAAKLKDKEARAADGARRKAEREARVARKQADHEAKVAEKIRAGETDRSKP